MRIRQPTRTAPIRSLGQSTISVAQCVSRKLGPQQTPEIVTRQTIISLHSGPVGAGMECAFFRKVGRSILRPM
jgi:hypothetical protein